MNLRPVLLGLLAALGTAVGLTAPAAALDVPTLTTPTLSAPTLTTPTLPAPTLPAPTAPAPTLSTPTVPAPTPTVTTPPALPAPTPTLPATTTSSSAPAPAPSSPVSQVTQTVQSATTAVTGTASGAAGTTAGAAGTTAGTAGGAVGSVAGTTEARTGAAAGGVPGGYTAGGGGSTYAASLPVSRVPIIASSSSGSGPGAKRPARPRKIVLGFISYRRGKLTLPVMQISPFCRRAGLIRVNARPGVNLIRFNGRLGKRWLHDGTYVLVTPTMRIRFAVVAGRPTRKKTRLQPSTCREGVEAFLAGESVPLGSAAAGLADGESLPVSDAGITDVGPPKVLPTGQSGPSKVLGTTIDEVRDVVTGLHPAFYVLLAMAIAALATATLPASTVPSPWLGATLARRRAELTLAGTMALVTVIVAYLFTVGT
jgi:hypothetical protein